MHSTKPSPKEVHVLKLDDRIPSCRVSFQATAEVHIVNVPRSRLDYPVFLRFA